MPSDYELSEGLKKNRLTAERDFFHDLIARSAGGEVDTSVEAENYSARDFVNSFDLESVPGDTPMRRALSLMKALELVAKEAPPEVGSRKGPVRALSSDAVSNEGGKFTFASPEKTARLLKKRFEAVKEMSDEEQTILGTDPVSIIKTGLKAGDFLRISRKLKRYDNFALRPTNKVKADVNGTDTRMRPIKDFSEIGRATSDFWGLPKRLQNFRMVTNQVMVREKVKKEDKKQLLYILVDVSGSMKDGDRRAKAVAVVLNRLTSVVRGEAVLIVRTFSNRLLERWEVEDATDAKTVMSRIVNHPFSENSTAIGNCTASAVQEIEHMSESGRFEGTKPDLAVVTDGQDTVDMQLEELRGIKLHAFVCDGVNEGLTQLAVKSGGCGVGSF
jgi:uncharacterized protein with von Willebrand factor type A (vWA) domain